MGRGGRKEEVPTLTLPGHEVNLDLCKRRKGKWHGAGGQRQSPATGPPPRPGCQLTHEMELGRQVAGKAFGHKAVVSFVCRRDVVNGQFVNPTEKWRLRGSPGPPAPPSSLTIVRVPRALAPALAQVEVWYFK